MVARLYPSSFYLKSEWARARDQFEVFGSFGLDEDDGIEVLKLIALREHLRQRAEGDKITVKGVREGDVLALTSEIVIREWALTVRAYASALEFARSRCGAVRKGLLPAPALVLVLADNLHPESPTREGYAEELERWYWATMFRQEYAQGANTQAVRDAQELRAWQQSHEQAPARIHGFRVDRDVLIDGRRRNEQLLRGLLGLTISRDARDWITDERFVDTVAPLEAHHVFPDDYLKDHYQGEKDPVINFAVLTESTNSALRDKLPRDVLIDPAVKSTSITSHLGIELVVLKEDKGDSADPAAPVLRFLRSRALRMEYAMYDAVGVAPPAPTADETS